MKKNFKPVKTIKSFGGHLLNAVVLALPAFAGGGVGAGLGRNGLWSGLGTMALAQQFGLPDAVKFLGIGMAVNGVTTTKPVTVAAQTAEVTVNSDGQLQGFLLIPDDFMTRAEQYYKNVAYAAYLDKVPVVKDVIGLSGIDQQASFAPNRAVKTALPAQSKAELNRIIAELQSGMAGVDSKAFEKAYNKGISGIDAALFEKGVPAGARRRTGM